MRYICYRIVHATTPMKKIFTTIILLQSAFFCAATAANVEDAPIENQETLANFGEISIKVNGTSVRITNAHGQTMRVYSVTGTEVQTASIDSNDKTITLNLNRGLYIIKVGDVTRKIQINK